MSLAGCRILIVEDEPLLAFDYADEFEERGATPKVAGTIDEAVSAVSSELPDLAVLDVNLGSDLVWPVAQILSQRDVPFFLVTGSRTDALPQGVRPTACLGKPVGAYFIADRLAEVVRERFA